MEGIMTITADILRQAAQKYQALGLPAIPAYRGRPLILWQVYQQRLPEPEEVEGWPWSKADGVAAICGHQSPGGGYWWVLDIEHQFRTEAEAWLDQHCPGWRQGLAARSQRNGLHIYCRSRQPVRTQKHRWGDVKGVGSLVFAPPSQRYKPDAVQDYEWLSFNPEEALRLEPTDLPWPDDPTQNGHQQEPLGPSLAETLKTTIPVGNRHNTMVRVAGWLRGVGQLEPDEILTVLQQMNRRCEEPLPDRELVEIARSSSKWPANPTLVVGNGHHQSSTGGDGQLVRKPVRFTGRETPPPRPWLIADVIPEGLPALLYGNGGSAKSYLAMLAGLAVAAGVPWLGKPTVQRPTLFADFELDETEQHRRARRLAIGLGLPDVPEAFEYVQLADLSPRDAEAVLVDWVATNPNGLVIVDSVGAAAITDLEKAQAVVQVFRNLRSLNPGGLLLIDHQAKLQAGQDYRDKTPFCSVYKYNLSRVVWQSELVESQSGEAWVILRNTKNNLGPLQGEIGAKLVFGEGLVTVTPVALTSGPLVERASLENRIIAVLKERGPSTAQEIADQLEANPKSVKAKLSRLKGLGRVVVTGTVGREHLWSLPGPPGHSPDDQGESSLTLTPYMSVNVNDGVNEPENPHQNCKIGEHDPGGVTGTVNDVVNEPENPHQNYENGEHDPGGGTGETKLSHREAKNGEHGCVICGKPVAHWGGRPAEYCSDACRMRAQRQRQLAANITGQVPVPTVVEGTTLTLTPYMSVNVNEPRHLQSAPGRVTPRSPATETNGHPPDPLVCLDCGEPISDPGFSYRCPRCLKARLDRLGWQYPPKLADWLEQQGNQ
jgi:predicted nucleic acid-binding Zn ribbon protein